MSRPKTISRDIFAGGLLLFVGGGIFVLIWHYPSGTMSDMGPGMVLQIASGVIALLGIIQILRSLKQSVDPAEGLQLRLVLRPFVIPAAMTVFALLLPWLGLAVTAACTTFIASYGSSSLSRRERIASALVLAAFVTLLFGYGLRLQVPIWPEFHA